MRHKFYKFFTLISEYAFYGLLFFIPISISLIEIFAGLMLFGFIGRKITKPDFRFIKFWPNIFLPLFLFFNAFSLLNSGQYLNISIHALFGKWIQYTGICIIIQDIVYDCKIIKRGMYVFLFSAVITIISGLSQYFFGIEFLRHKIAIVIDNGLRAATSSFVHYNSFGAYLVIVLSLSSTLLLGGNISKVKNFILLAFSVIAALTLLLTLSRGSWLAFSISFIFIFVLGERKSWRLLPIFLIIIIAFLSLPAIHERISLVFNYGGDKDRIKYWTAALRMISVHPFFGVGLGTFMANFKEYLKGDFWSAYAHNCYLQIWAEAGIFSLISFLLFVNAIIVLGVKSFFDSKDFLMLGLLAGIIGFMIHSFFDVGLYSLQFAFLFWIWIGLIIARLNPKDLKTIS